MFSDVERLFGTFSDIMGGLVMGHFESGTFWAVGRLVHGMFSDGTISDRTRWE
jgi:hypothetical protein